MYKITDTELRRWSKNIDKYLNTMVGVSNIRKHRALLMKTQLEINNIINPERYGT